MGFSRPKGIFAGQLAPAEATPFTTDTLKSQLNDVGLNCGQLTKDQLQGYIDTVTEQLAKGATQTMAIKAPPRDLPPPSGASNAAVEEPKDPTSLEATVPPMDNAATGNWTINDEAEGYSNMLEVIQYPDHFNWLYNDRASNGFTGIVDAPPAYTGLYQNVDAIMNLFVSVGVIAAATVVKGVDQDSMKATFTNVIQPLKNESLVNFNQSDSRAIFLVDNYNDTTGYADGIGVLSVSWTLSIADYKQKEKDGGLQHNTRLVVNATSVLYSDPVPLCTDYKNILQQFGITDAPECPNP